MLDQDYRPQAIQDSRSDGLNIGFGFDPVGNLTALTAPGNTAPVVSLGYDNLDRLTAFKDGPTGTVIDGYSYDATGNRLSAQVNGGTQTYNYPTDSHRLAGVTGAARSYDGAGNTTAIDGTAREFAYDATGRLSQAKRSGTLAMEYRYNDRGEQVRRFLGTTNTYTLYDEAGHWLGDYDTNGKALQQAIWLDDLPVGVLAGTTLNYVQPDHLGAPRTVIDPVRDVAIWKWDIKGEAFGNTPPDQDADRDGTAFVFGMRFPGQRYDSATGLNQNYFRDYDATGGRYTQSDPTGLGGGASTYGYAGGTPLAAVDRFGLIVKVVENDPAVARLLMSAYAELNAGSEVARFMNGELERSSDVYEIRVSRDGRNLYCPLGSGSLSSCGGRERTVFVDPCHMPQVKTTAGLQTIPLPIAIAHELGHAWLGYQDNPGRGDPVGDNIRMIENPIRAEMNIPLRTEY